MISERAIDLIDIIIPIVSVEQETWEMILRLFRVRRICASTNQILSGRSVKMFRVRDLVREIFISSEEESVVTEISRIDGVFRRSVAEASAETAFIDPETSAVTVLELMDQLSLECVPVARRDVVIGVVSEESVLEELKKYMSLESEVSQIATRDVDTVDSEAPLEEVIGLMLQKGFRRIPVQDSEKRVLGLVTLLDVVAEIAEQYRVSGELRTLDMMSRPVSQMRYLREPVFVSSEKSVREVVDIMLRSGTGCVLLGSREKIEGIATERDVIRYLRREIARIIE